MKTFLSFFAALLIASACAASTPPFNIYLAVGQSNMEGYGTIEDVDLTDVPDRFKTMACTNFPNLGREKFQWYTATPPIVREDTNLGVLDWFGRTMVANLPDDVTIGVVSVALGGSELKWLSKNFDSENVSQFPEWFQGIMAAYGNQPYNTLIECAKEAQKSGTIKGILFLQGEADHNDATWPGQVRDFYHDILSDLNLNAEDVPLILGETVPSSSHGTFGTANGLIAEVPNLIPTAHVVSASGLEHRGDRAHFNSQSYRVMGCRYAETVLKLRGIDSPILPYVAEYRATPTPDPTEGDFEFPLSDFMPGIHNSPEIYDPNTGEFTTYIYGFGGWEFDMPIDLSGFKYLIAELSELQQCDTSFRIYDNRNYLTPYVKLNFPLDGKVVVADLHSLTKPVDMDNESKGVATFDPSHIYRFGFSNWGGTPIYIRRVFASNSPIYSGINDVIKNVADEVPTEYFDIFGRRVDSSAKGILIERRGSKIRKIVR